MKARFPMPTDYGSHDSHANYRCGQCGALHVKLWRLWNTFLKSQLLFCASCAVPDETVSQAGKLRGSDQLPHPKHGTLAPAVPTEAGDTFWGYTSVPQDGCQWWYRLPTYPLLGKPTKLRRR